MKATRTELHDRATRGITLSGEEQADLEAWYAQQDAEEHLLYDRYETSVSSKSLLGGQIDIALNQIATLTQQIQSISRQNEELRQEVANLQLMLVRRMEAQVA